ncbi:sigma-70 family RNA polymerase sigma factor [Clostridium sp. YIM B02515]|uniref:Sigma-70 family RNA polymerase sigma factor n=1 Tax=Clostridium rhizosphaerae TaxID=2803861 RepID=A0ABS1TDA4_9CLOT|nr:sigma-70 family RNA polymerase sigma factor [Clostridium rhizosphaerae]MBL4937336.1 sigma-70 family RNA polymerase sigma factor [Clostridium rhizosphaerae]
MNLEAYAKKIFGFALTKTNNVQDAEDLSQEILISLYNSSEKINKVDNVDAYVYKICLYTWSNFYRRQRRHWNNINIDILLDLRDKDEIDDLIEEEERQNLILMLRKELAYMSKVYREILIKFYFEKKSIKEISKELYTPQGTVKWYLYEAKRKLREDIKLKNSMESYRPIKMSVGHCGNPGKNNEPNSYFSSLLYQNIAYVAYKEPMTIEEISRKLEVGAAFVEEALENLEYSDLIKKTGNKYQTAFFIYEPKDSIPLLDMMIEKSEQVALPIYEALYGMLEKIKSVGFLGSNIDENVLMWTLYPCCIQLLLEKVEDYKELSNTVPPEHKDGGKYIANGSVQVREELRYKGGKYSQIYSRYSCEGLKTREADSNLHSYQIDSYFEGLKWREFNASDLDKLWRISEIVRNNIKPNEFEKIIIAEYVQLGYLSVDNEKVSFNFPIMTKEEKEEVFKTIDNEFERLNSKTLLKCLANSCYKLWKGRTPSTIPDNDVRYRALNDVSNIIIGCMEYIERIGKLRTPKEEEKGALSTIVWKE